MFKYLLKIIFFAGLNLETSWRNTFRCESKRKGFWISQNDQKEMLPRQEFVGNAAVRGSPNVFDPKIVFLKTFLDIWVHKETDSELEK